MIPLNECKEDIPVLIEYFWGQLSEDLAIKSSLIPNAKLLLNNYSYPGNVCELKNVIERLIVLTPENGRVDVAQLPYEMRDKNSAVIKSVVAETANSENNGQHFEPPVWKVGMSLEDYLGHIEGEVLKIAFDLTGQNQVHTAEMLGINRGTLQYKIKKHLLDKKKAA